MPPRPSLAQGLSAITRITALLQALCFPGPARRGGWLLLAAACLALGGCATKTISPVTYAAVSGKVHAGQRVEFSGRSSSNRSIKVRAVRETCLVSDAQEEFPYADMDSLKYQGFSTEVRDWLVLPLVPVAAVVIVVGGTVILVGSAACFVLTGSEKCGALLTS